MGLAFHFSHQGHFAEVADVSVDKSNKVTVHKMTVVGDIGPIVNLSGAENQCQGCIVDAISTLGLAVTFENGRIEQSNFDKYPIGRIVGAAAGARRALPRQQLPADRRRRAGVPAGGAGDLQCDLRGDGEAHPDSADYEGRVFDLGRPQSSRAGDTANRTPVHPGARDAEDHVRVGSAAFLVRACGQHSSWFNRPPQRTALMHASTLPHGVGAARATCARRRADSAANAAHKSDRRRCAPTIQPAN